MPIKIRRASFRGYLEIRGIAVACSRAPKRNRWWFVIIFYNNTAGFVGNVKRLLINASDDGRKAIQSSYALDIAGIGAIGIRIKIVGYAKN